MVSSAFSAPLLICLGPIFLAFLLFAFFRSRAAWNEMDEETASDDLTVADYETSEFKNLGQFGRGVSSQVELCLPK